MSAIKHSAWVTLSNKLTVVLPFLLRVDLKYILCIFMIFLQSQAWADSEINSYFDQGREFKNYFLPLEYRDLPPTEIPTPIIIQQRDLVQSAMGSIFERMTVPIVTDPSQGPTLTHYYPYLKNELKKLDPMAKILPSAGVVRAVYTYLYEEMRKAEVIQPGSGIEVLRKIAFEDKFDLSGFGIRGVGGDFDVFLLSSDLQNLKQKLLDVTNSAEGHAGFTNSKHEMKRLFFSIGDSKDYNEQILRASNQGGSTVDLLAFDLDSRKVVEPARFPHAFDDLIRGVADYAPPISANIVEDIQKQTVRGLRTLIELPWIHYRDEHVLVLELKSLLKDIKAGQLPNQKALEQFGKALRNARYGGANNRYYRGAPGSIDNLVKQVLAELYKITKKIYFPEFIDFRSLSRNPESRAGKHVPRKILMPTSEFIQTYTNSGFIYHGVPSLDQAMAILRQGLFISKADQGLAAWGRGAYSSKDINFATAYASVDGLVLNIKINDKKDLRIINWPEVKDTKFMTEVSHEAQLAGRDIFEYLSREYEIDIIVNQHVLIQNSEAVSFPNGIKNLLEGLQQRLLSDRDHGSQRTIDLELAETLRLTSYAKSVGVINSQDESRFFAKLLAHWELLDTKTKVLLAGQISEAAQENLELQNIVSKYPSVDVFYLVKKLSNDIVEYSKHEYVDGHYLDAETLVYLVSVLKQKKNNSIYNSIEILNSKDLPTIQCSLAMQVVEGSKEAAILLSLTDIKDIFTRTTLAYALSQGNLAAKWATSHLKTKDKMFIDAWVKTIANQGDMTSAIEGLLRSGSHEPQVQIAFIDAARSKSFELIASEEKGPSKRRPNFIPSIARNASFEFVLNIRTLDPTVIEALVSAVANKSFGYTAYKTLKAISESIPNNHLAKEPFSQVVASAYAIISAKVSYSKLENDPASKNLLKILRSNLVEGFRCQELFGG